MNKPNKDTAYYQAQRKALIQKREEIEENKRLANSAFDELEEKAHWAKGKVANPEVFTPVLNTFEQQRSDYHHDFKKQLQKVDDDLAEVDKELSQKEEGREDE
ncbi:hypothetical protein FEI15_01265 [Lacticaseibacillus zeae]|uniref:Uncharacterized protein n=1 Tax=Lacticaseibacillus zeae TaxID=57037 RepID=A0A5R8LX36_LACZE|nr:hypothetical protein [Lacticaseibacillus zeae]TLF41868.1 hypothetical protein FEI15_01265 [Lacticaseibacillus zeae]